MGALVVLAAQAGSIEPGAEAETVVLVRNTGDLTDTFHVVVQGEASAWAVVDPPALTLRPDEEGPVWVHFRPSRTSETRPGTFPFAVAVTSVRDPDFVAVETGEIDVGTYSSLSASFAGDPTMGARWAEAVVAIRNTGNRRVQVDVAAESEVEGAVFEIEPASIDLRPGQPATVHVRMRPPRQLLPGRRTDRRITVSVVSDGGALATLRTEYPSDPSLVNELVRSARVLGVLLVLLFIAGIALLRSESTTGTVAVTQNDDAAEARLPLAETTTTSAPSAPPPAAAEESPTGSVGAHAGTPAPTEPAGRTAAGPPALAKLVFVRVYGPAVRDVVVRNPGARGGELRLRSDNALESRPKLSPDGDYVALIREREANWKVCVVPAVGGDVVCLADTTSDGAVAWAPNGASLYFSRGGSLYSVPYDVATQTAGPEADLGIPVPVGGFSLSPDGGRIVSAEARRLLVRPLDGSATVSIEVPNPPADASFSPDGSRIVFAADFHVYIVPAAGGQVRQLTGPGSVNGEPAWSGDGDWVVFRSNRTGTGDLYAVKGDSSSGSENGLAQVTATPEREITPSF